MRRPSTILRPRHPFSRNYASAQSLGLANWWSGGQGGGILFDRVGRKHGALVGFPSPYIATSGWATGKDDGRCLAFDGIDDYVLVPTITLAGDFALSTWFNSPDLSASRVLFGTLGDSSVYTGFLSGTTTTIVWHPASTYNFAVPAVAANTWHHLVITRLGTTARLYLDGVESSTGGLSAADTFTLNLLGSYATTSAGWNGRLDDIRVYNRALSPAEARAIYAPSTRWQLYYQPRHKATIFTPAGGPATYSGTGAITLESVGCAGSATFTAAPVYSGTGAISTEAVVCAGDGTLTAPVYSGTGAITLEAVVCAGTGIFATAVYSGIGSISLDAATCSGEGTFAAPVYSGAGAIALPAVTCTGTGTFAPLAFAGAGAIALDAVTCAGVGTFTVSTVYPGTGTITLEAVICAGVGTFVSPVTFDAWEDKLASAIAAELNDPARLWVTLFTTEGTVAARSRSPWYQAAELATLKVAVVPLTIDRERISRDRRKFDYAIGIDLQKRVEPTDDAQLKALSKAAEDMHDFFDNAHELTGYPGWTCLRAERLDVYNLDLLHEERTWETFISVNVRGYRA